jgi:glutaredoxin 3
MAKITIYSSDYCGFCVRAKSLLASKGVQFTEHKVDNSPALRQEARQRSGRTSVPQIWIDGLHVGGCDELMALERQNKLDSLLAQ